MSYFYLLKKLSKNHVATDIAHLTTQRITSKNNHSVKNCSTKLVNISNTIFYFLINNLNKKSKLNLLFLSEY